MEIIQYISNIAMPFIILMIIVFAMAEKKQVFDVFLKGAKEGIEIVFSIFPTLIGLFMAINLLKDSGLLDFVINVISPFLHIIDFPEALAPLALIRPISGNAAIAIATEIMQTHGVDSQLGIMASVIMGATETTVYTLAVYTSCIKVKKTRFIIVAALIADVVGMLASVAICRFLS